MSIALVHISDIHFSNKFDNPVLSRKEALLAALRAKISPSDQCSIIFSGDIANWGLAEEYEIALDFIESIYSGINDHIHSSPTVVIVPGNHDLDFSDPEYDEQMRDTLIDGCSPKKLPTEKIREIFLQPQSKYRGFLYTLKDRVKLISVADLIDHGLHDADDFQVRFHLLNTTSLCRKKDVSGQNWFPINLLSDHFSEREEEKTTITIAVMHHPWNWNQPENQTEMRQCLESHCDLILTGHYHTPDAFSHSRSSTEKNLYVEGGVLQNADDDKLCSFNFVRVDLEEKVFQCVTMTFDGNEFTEGTSETEHKFLRLRNTLRTEFAPVPEFLEWLEQVGTDFVHPRARNLKLSDVFAYPDLQKLDIRKACKPSGLVHDQEVIGFLQDKRYVAIAGAEKSGKTSLAKTIFRDLSHAGLLPLLVRSDFRVGGSKRTPMDERIREGLTNVVEKIYGKDSCNKFWGVKTDERVIIIDDYDALPFAVDGKDGLLRYLNEHFGCVIVIASPEIRMREVLNRSRSDAFLWTFEHVDILECDAETRYHLIYRWLKTGADPFEVSQDELHHQSIRYHQIIDNLIGQGSVPALPLFIQMMMQQLESGQKIGSSGGMYGTLYELIINDVLRSVSSKPTDLEVFINYLSELAHNLYLHKTRHLDEVAFVGWHTRYCDTFPHLQRDWRHMSSILAGAGVLRVNSEGIWFKYRYYYCYFLARYLADHIHEESTITDVEKFCGALYNSDAADTMLFLCHRSKNPKILEMILNNTRSHFSKLPEYDLTDSTAMAVLSSVGIRPLTLPEGSPANQRLKELRKQDELTRPHGLDASDDSNVIKKSNEGDAEIGLLHEFASSFHAVRLCGQIIRNFFGGMPGTQQVELIEACYGVSLRSMSAFIELLEKGREELADFFTSVLAQKNPDATKDELDARVKQTLHFMAIAVCYGVSKHCSNSVGLVDIKPSLDSIVASEKCSISRKLLDLSTRLDYFETFPQDKVSDLHAAIEEHSLGHELLRFMVWNHFKLFACNYDVRQKVCSDLKIKYAGTITLEAQKPKKALVDKNSLNDLL